VVLGRYPTPVVALRALSPNLWIKRDDLCADPVGGNKVRALEFLLGDMKPDESIVTVGSAGSTHALAVAVYGKRLGGRVVVGRWKQEMNDVATRVAARVGREAYKAPIFSSVAAAYAWAWRERAQGARWIAAGGSTPHGILGHVNAGLELIEQIDAGVLPQPARVVVPLGTGGTAAGLSLAFAIAKRDITVVGARVVPRIVARKARVLGLAKRTAQLIERTMGATGQPLPRVRADLIEVVQETYGGAYGRETDAARAAAAQLRTVSAIRLDGTYSAKAFAHALTVSQSQPTLFWLTFDSRPLGSS
jgi:D-cysteine desulfhydrase